MATEVDHALARLTAAAARASAKLSPLHATTDVLPMAIRQELVAAAEAVDYLRYLLHEATLKMATFGSLKAAPGAVAGRSPARSR